MYVHTTMQTATKAKKVDDLTPKEIEDVKEFRTGKTKHKVSSLEELIKELDS